jgi:phosphomannomutase
MTRIRRQVLDRRQGILAVDLSLDQLRQAVAGLTEPLRAQGLRCHVSYDTRFMANLFAARIAGDLSAAGVAATLSPAATPLPALYEALNDDQADCCLYLSAGNAPYYESGILLIGAAQSGLRLSAGGNVPAAPFPATVETALLDLRPAYLDALRERVDLELIRRAAITCFVDVMGGCTAGIFSGLLAEGGPARAFEINRERDAWFAGGAPQPTQQPLVRLRKLVRESDSQLGIAISGDGCALAVIDDQGETIASHELALALGGYLAQQQRRRGSIVLPISLQEQLRHSGEWSRAAGGITLEFSADPQAAGAEQTLLALGPDGTLRIGRQSDVADGVLAGLLLLEFLVRSGGPFSRLIAAQRRLTGTATG